MRALADAGRVVARARRRLTLASVADGGCRGALAGAVAGSVVVGVRLFLGLPSGWVAAAALPAVGAAAGCLLAFLSRPGVAAAALRLDGAARTDEAFVSALTAKDARPEFRELAARYALDRCDRAAVSRFLPFEPPTAALGASVALAALAALVLLPQNPAAPPPVDTDPVGDLVPVAGSGGGLDGPGADPRRRVAELKEALRQARTSRAEALAPVARTDLAAVPEGDLEELARMLAEGGDEDAAAALEALARGDRGAAVEALRRALGGAQAPMARGSGGGGAAAAPVPGHVTPSPWAAPSWPLRYDRTVRRWTEASLEAGTGAPGGVR